MEILIVGLSAIREVGDLLLDLAHCVKGPLALILIHQGRASRALNHRRLLLGAFCSSCSGSQSSTLGEDVTFVLAPEVCSSVVLDLGSIRSVFYVGVWVVDHILEEGDLGCRRYSLVWANLISPLLRQLVRLLVVH